MKQMKMDPRGSAKQQKTTKASATEEPSGLNKAAIAQTAGTPPASYLRAADKAPHHPLRAHGPMPKVEFFRPVCGATLVGPRRRTGDRAEQIHSARGHWPTGHPDVHVFSDARRRPLNN